MNYYKELYKILDDIFHDDLATEKMLQEEATNKFVKSLLKKQREKCAEEYFNKKEVGMTYEEVYNLILNAPEPDYEKIKEYIKK